MRIPKSFRHRGAVVGLILLATGLCSCATTATRQAADAMSAGDYARAIPLLTQDTIARPTDAKVWARLGEAQYHEGQPGAARTSFERALCLDTNLAPAHLFLGYILEAQDSLTRATDEYRAFIDLRPRGRISGEVALRLEELRRAQAAGIARAALAHEKELKPGRFSDSTLGIVHFNSERLSEPWRPLGRGLAEMLAADLAAVAALRVADRLQTDLLLAELASPGAPVFDTTTAPRLGKLLGTARVLGGGMTELPQGRLRIEPQLVSTNTGEVDPVGAQVGSTGQLLQMEKQVVFDVLKHLKIDITPEERTAIGRIPTTSLTAFLAFSRGLEYEDRGMYAEARREFHAAVSTDPKFRIAGEHARVLVDMPARKQGGQPRTLDEFVKATADTREWTPGTSGADARLDDLMSNAGLLPAIGPAGAPDDPYTPPASSTTVIIHGHFDLPPR